MFGYVTAHEPELKVKEFHKYKGYYRTLSAIEEKLWASRTAYADLRYDIFDHYTDFFI